MYINNMKTLINYLVWLDPELKEIIALEKSQASAKFLNQLKKENIEISEVEAQNVIEASQIWLNNFESVNSSANFLSANLPGLKHIH